MSESNMQLPAEMRYSDLLPVGVKSRHQRNIFRSSAATYDSKGNNKSLIDIHGDMFLNARCSYLQFDVNVTAAGNPKLRLDSSAHSLIKSITIRAGSREIEKISEYNLLHAMLADTTMDMSYRSSVGAISEGLGDGHLRYGNDRLLTGNKIYDDEEKIAHWENEANSTLRSCGPSVFKTDGTDTKTFCLNLASGFLQCARYIPLLCLRSSSGFQLEVEWADIAEAFVSFEQPTAAAAAAAPPSANSADKFTINNLQYNADCLYFSSDFNANFITNMQASGGLQIHCSNWSHSSYVSMSSTGEQNIPVNHRFKSLKSLMSIVRDNTTLMSYDSKTLTKRCAVDADNFHYRIGGESYPQYPIGCKPGNSPAEAISNLELCFGKLGSVNSCSNLDRTNFCPIQTKVQKGQQGQFESKMIYAVDLELYGSNSGLLESGLNTSSGSPQMVFNIKKTGDKNLDSERVDVFGSYDCLITILPDLTMASQS